ncbi:hypothetical protein TIFTF001_001659 [Ficus carica]|uniref:non-specific serine/threonine protein kinase n=1 Tax=Ficus carica TaxID=3494 RepID=A0AA87Z7Q0_FICCA|nr:hypothetical protein TIFTF001_001659 [Ficus carica]
MIVSLHEKLELEAKMWKHFHFAYFGVLALIVFVHAQDQSGFISLDCGISEDSNYTDQKTGLNYISDESFIDSGVSRIVLPEYRASFVDKQVWNLRSFPDGLKNCYTLKSAQAKGNKYLIRATFLYGNYDQNGTVPIFDLYLGGNKWDTVKLINESMIQYMEIVHIPYSNYIFVCLVNTGYGTPFISALELRPLGNSTYRTPYASLLLYKRMDIGSATNTTIRYKDDLCDRIWWPYSFIGWKLLTTSLIVDANAHTIFYPPSSVMETAMTPANSSDPIEFYWTPDNPNSKFYVYMYFAEVEELQPNQTREFNISQNDEFFTGPISPTYLYTTIAYSQSPVSGDKIQYTIRRTASYSGGESSDPLRIISLDLSSSGLTGEIDPSLSGLKTIKTLNLSNNNLTGQVPDFLSELQFLQVLVDDNLKVCSTDSCTKKKKNNSAIPIAVSVVAAFGLLTTFILLIWCLKKRKKADKANKANPLTRLGSLEPKNRQFSFSEILTITNNFERVIGKGGFGTVYHGYLNDTQVAVKMLSPTLAQGNKEFQADVVVFLVVKLLLRVHHRNLTSLVGYCNEGTHMGVVYEYMANGNLGKHLADKSAYVLTWEERLRIAIDAAQGLEYLHNGCKPPIIHRDVKPSNILLNERFQANLADFGLSRVFPSEDGSRVSTVVAGSPGYLDPEYYVSNWLNEKSDVYSFGVVLLEIVTSRSVLVQTNERPHIVQWVSSMLQNGEIKDIVDPRLQGDFSSNSAWKALEIAMACVLPTSARRPTMINVVMDLKECLILEVARRRGGYDAAESKDSNELISMNVNTEISSPFAR